MGSSVKTVFKILIGTIVVIVGTSLLVELYNIQFTTMNLRSMQRLAAQQACDMFSQETYKVRGGGSRNNLLFGDIWETNTVSDDGGTYAPDIVVSGNIYGSTDIDTVYNRLYTTPEFKAFLNNHSNEFYSLKLLNYQLNGVGSLNETEKAIAETYIDSYYTPLNVGVTYLDKDSTSNIFKWGLTKLLSDCNPNNIRRETPASEPYIMYKGFRCYTSQASIDNITYKVYNLNDANDKAEFQMLTGINGDNLSRTSSDTISDGSNNEFNSVCVAEVEFSMPVSYRGITPLKKVLEYVWNKRVDGLNGPGATHNANTESWNDATESLKGGGTGSSSLPTSGILVYYVIR